HLRVLRSCPTRRTSDLAPVAAPGRTSLAATVDAGVPATEPRTYVGLVTRAIAFAVDAALIDGIAIVVAAAVAVAVSVLSEPASLDRKSTRLNSSHVKIS